ncbi:MAG TPA: hypothetical protein VE153_36345 [Myxococcus sp.]|nr:hypothetical protein [Myxococcus sp.]
MTVALRIGRLRATYRLPATVEEPEAMRERLDAAAGGILRDALGPLLPGVLSALGLGPDVEVAVERLAVRVRVRGTHFRDEEVSAGWARAITEALVRSLERLVRVGGGVGEGVALFANRFEAEREYLRERLAGTPESWWWEPVLGRGGDVPSVVSVLFRWVQEAPERLPAALAALALEQPEGLMRELTDAQARGLAEALVAVRAQRLRVLRAPLAPAGEAPAPRVSVAPGAVSEGVAPSELREWLELVGPEAPRILWRVRGPVRRLLALAFTLAKQPTWRTSPALLAAIERESSPERLMALAGADAEALTLDRAPSKGPEARRRPDADAETARSGGAQPREAPKRGTEPERQPREGHEVFCGGLLLLVRRVVASDLTERFSGTPLERRLVALGWLALLRVLAPLPEGARRAALERERPLLEVFAGTDRLPETLHEPPEGPEAEDARALLDALVEALPAGLEPSPGGFEATYGAVREPFAPTHPDRALACLLLRPGRLDVEATEAHLYLPMRMVDLSLRRAGWDLDPGFVPLLGRVIRFHYEGT